MKKLILMLSLSSALALPTNKPAPLVDMQAIPITLVVQHENVVLAAIGAGVLIGVAGWGAFKAVDKILNIWEHQLTNSVPQLGWSFNLEDEYPE